MLKVLMCGSSLSVKGGMVSVAQNYLSYQSWDEVKIIYVPTHIETSKYILIPYFGFAYCRLLYWVVFRKIKIVHLHTAERGSFYRKAFIVQSLKKLGVKTIMHHHGAEFELFYETLSKKRKRYVNRILEMVDLNIVLSKRLVPMIKSKSPKANVSVLYNSVNTYGTNPYNFKARNILFLGRLGERKGIYDLLKVIKTLDLEIDKDIKYYLCGDGEIEEVKKRILEMGINHRIAYVGWINGKQKQQVLSETMINVLPSYNEGLPMTILETMACGIPNVSTAVASIPEVLKHGDNGFLVTPGDVDKLAQYIKKLINDVALRKHFSEKSYELILSSFSLDVNIEELKATYKNLLS